MKSGKPVHIKNTDYYAERASGDRFIRTIIGEKPEGRDSINQTITVYAAKDWGKGRVFEPATITWPAFGSQPVEVAERFVIALNFALAEARRINKKIANLNASKPSITP